MIKIEHTDVYGFESAIRGMRNPMNSWDKSDSGWGIVDQIDTGVEPIDVPGYIVGENDLKLMQTLSKSGSDHGKFLRMITVTLDITAPLYWWSEYDTYKVGTVANSCSKMHKLLHKPFEMEDFSFDQLPGYKRDVRQFTPEVDEDDELWVTTTVDSEYYVSNYGRVRHNDRILSGSIHADGYVFITIKGKQYPKHRLVAEAFIPNPDNKPFVNHIDGNRQNCTSLNLEWCTQSENIKHAHATGLQPKGLTTYKGKFSPEQRDDIKCLWDSGYSRREIARRYGVSHTCINDIITNRYAYVDRVNVFETVARPIVDILNELRDAWFSESDDIKKKQIWYSILQLLPESYNQKRTVQLNYQVLKAMYHARKAHKLDEWRSFCSWIETLPYAKELIIGEE